MFGIPLFNLIKRNDKVNPYAIWAMVTVVTNSYPFLKFTPKSPMPNDFTTGLIINPTPINKP